MRGGRTPGLVAYGTEQFLIPSLIPALTSTSPSHPAPRTRALTAVAGGAIALNASNIDERRYRLLPSNIPSGVLFLRRRDDGWWWVCCDDGREPLVSQIFPYEDEACRFFLQYVLSDPTFQRGFRQEDLGDFADYEAKKRRRLRQHGLDERLP